MAYNTDPTVVDPAGTYEVANLRGQAYSTKLIRESYYHNDYGLLEGPEGSDAIFWRHTEVGKAPGKKITRSVMGGIGSRGDIQGKTELTGSTGDFDMNPYSIELWLFRDGVEIDELNPLFLAAGKGMPEQIQQALIEKRRFRMQTDRQMFQRTQSTANNTMYPEGRGDLDDIAQSDLASPELFSRAKQRGRLIGMKPMRILNIGYKGSKVPQYCAFLTSFAAESLRDNSQYVEAETHAQVAGDDNPLFSGKLVPWRGVWFFEHEIVHEDWDDVLGSPLAPEGTFYASGATGTLDNNANATISFGLDTTDALYSQFFPGYRKVFSQNLQLAVDSGKYYLWVVNPDGTGAFCEYTGSGNDGHDIDVDKVLGSGSGDTDSTVGNVAWASLSSAQQAKITGTITKNANIYLANANGALIGWSFLFGKGSMMVGYSDTQAYVPTKQDRDFGHIRGFGYKDVRGQCLPLDSQGKVRRFILMPHAIKQENMPPFSYDPDLNQVLTN